MDNLLAILFGMPTRLCVANPRSVVTMIVRIHIIEQLHQAGVLFLCSVGVGGQLGNNLIGFAGFGSALLRVHRTELPFVGLIRITTAAIPQLLPWTAVSTLWSRDRVGWFEMAVAKWPCDYLCVPVAPVLRTNTADVTSNTNFQTISSSETEPCFYLSWTEATWAT
jgi:hypothetical protein